MTERTQVLGPWSRLEAALSRRLEELRHDDPLRPLAVVCGSAAAASHVRRSVTRLLGGLVAVDFTTIHRLASGLAASQLRDAGTSPADEAESLRLLGAVLDAAGATSYYSRIRTMPGLPRALLRTFKDLREARVTPELLGSLEGEGPGELAALYARYVEVLAASGRCDDASLYEVAARALGADPRALPPSWVGLYGLYDLPETQRGFVRALVHGRQIDAYVPGPPDAVYSAPVREFYRVLGCAPHAPPGLAARGGAEASPSVEVVSVEDAAAERREILRRVVAAAEGGLAFREVAVVHADAGWRGLFVESLQARGIPVAARVKQPTPATRVLSALLACVAPVSGPPLDRAALVDLAAASAQLGRHETSAAARWDRVSRDGRVIAGAEQWHVRVTASAGHASSSAATVGELLAFVDEVEALRVAARGLTTWPALAQWLAGGLLAMRVPPDDPALSAVRRLARLADIEPRVGLDAFAAVAREVVAEQSERVGSLGRSGVAVVSPEQVRGIRFPVVLFGGLVEGLFPPRPAPDPLLDDDSRARLTTQGCGRLATVALRSQESDLLFALTRDTATASLVLLRARSRDGTGAPQLPSRNLLALCGELAGEPLAFAAVDTDGAVGGRVTRIAASPALLPGWPGEVAGADVWDMDAAVLGRLHLHGDRRLTEDYLAAILGSGEAMRRLAGLRSRRAPRLTAWDGLVTDASLSEAVLGRPVSVSAVEDYLSCPFVFYTRHVLGASAVEEPEDAFEPRSLDVGLLVHKVLERVFKTLREDAVGDVAAALTVLERAVDEVFTLGQLEGVTGYPLAWESRRRRLAHDLRMAVTTDPSWRDDLRPASFEWSFGGDVPGPAIAAGGRRLTFRGRVDRVDRDASGERVRLIDYKTGKGKVEKEHLESGHDIQLPVYRLAAGALSPVPSEVVCSFRFVTRAGGFKDLSLPGSLEESTAMLVKRLAAFVAGVEGGLFPRRHGGDRCRWCDVAYACGARTPSEAQKQSDSRLAPPEGEGEGS